MAKKNSLLHDIWVPAEASPLISYFSSIVFPHYINNMTISKVISSGQWTVMDHVLLPVWNIISNQTIPTSDSEIAGDGLAPVQACLLLDQLGKKFDMCSPILS